MDEFLDFPSKLGRSTIQNLVYHLFDDWVCLIGARELRESWAFTRVSVEVPLDDDGYPHDDEKYLISALDLKLTLGNEAAGWIEWVLDWLLLAEEKGEIKLNLPKWTREMNHNDIATMIARKKYPEAFREFILYRFWAEHELLYIGKSVRAFDRLKQHQQSSSFFHLADAVTLERFENAESLDRAEREAIRSENPKYNKVRYEVKA